MPTTVPSAEVLMRRGLLLFGLIWQGLWLGSDPNLWPGRQAAPYEGLLIAFVWITWIVLIVGLLPSRFVGMWPVRIRYPFVLLNVTALILSAVAMSLNSISPNTNEWLTSAALFNLAAGMAGILIRDPRQWWWVAGVVVTEGCLFIFFGLALTAKISVNSAILYPSYAMAIGVAAASSQLGLMRRARAADNALQETVISRLRAQKLRDANDRLVKRRALIHESVLNTLTAIARGGLSASGISSRTVRERAAESAAVLRSLVTDQRESDRPSLIGLLDHLGDLLQECTARGMVVDIKGSVSGAIPQRVQAPIVAAMREVLINALRHSQASEISIDFVRMTTTKFKVVIKDNGVGFDQVEAAQDLTNVNKGLGLRHILSQDLEAVNVCSEISSSVGSGTEITIEFHDRSHWWSIVFERQKTPTSILVVPVVLGGMTFAMINFILTWTLYGNVILNSLAMILILTLAVTIAITSMHGSIPGYVALLAAIVAPVVYLLEAQARETGILTPWVDWTSEGLAALFFVISAAGPWWAWIAVGLSWLVFQGGFPAELVAPGFGLIIAGAVLGRSLRSIGRTRENAILATAQSQIQSEIAELGTAKSLQKFSTPEIFSSLGLLEGIANGEIDFETETCRHSCSVTDSYLRNILTSDVSQYDLATSVATVAFHNDVVLDIHSNGTLWGCVDQVEFVAFCAQIIRQLEWRDSVRCTLERVGPNLVINLVVRIDQGSHFDASVVDTQPGSTTVSEFFHESDGSVVYMWQAVSPELVSS